MELLDLDAARSAALIGEQVASDRSVREVYEWLMECAGDRILVDKSPSYADHLETLRQAEAWFGSRARYIHLVRHPYAMIESFARLRMHKLYGHGNADPHRFGEEVWAACNRNIRDFFAEVPASRCHTIHYETLVRSPEDTARSLCAFLDIPFEPALVSPYEGERMTDGVHPTSLPLDDPNFQSHKRIEPALADAWKLIELPIALRPETEALAAELGYSPPRSAASGPVPAEMAAATESQAEAGDMATMEEHFLSVQGLRLCRCTWGAPAAEHVVLCIHGLLDHGGAWEPVAARLSRRGIMVVAPDLRGHGRSQHAPSYVWEDFLADVDATLRSLGHDLWRTSELWAALGRQPGPLRAPSPRQGLTAEGRREILEVACGQHHELKKCTFTRPWMPPRDRPVSRPLVVDRGCAAVGRRVRGWRARCTAYRPR
jgi:hypothetical protein